jgi:hypothetical protein
MAAFSSVQKVETSMSTHRLSQHWHWRRHMMSFGWLVVSCWWIVGESIVPIGMSRFR